MAVGVLAALTGLVLAGNSAPDLRDERETDTEMALLLAPSQVYNPVAAGEELPTGFRQAVPRDAIRPVYEPTFVDASTVDWPASSLVIGLELGGHAKAYPVEFLSRREMVIDSLVGIPVLVTW